jgi:TRAP-type C4-dicarboxylate transport system permease small subunit
MKRLRTLLVWIPGGALLLAMTADTLAMLGRQVSVPLLGAIELVQASVLIAACGALLLAALEHAHARVHLLLDRMPGATREFLERMHAVSTSILYAALLVGSAWIAIDLWQGHEESELLRIPYRPLRVIVVVTLTVLLLHTLQRVFRRAAK